MSDKKEHLSDKGKAQVAKETKEAIKPVIDQLKKKFDGMGFDKKDVMPAIKRGIDEAKADVE